MTRTPEQKRVVAVYVATSGFYTLATSIIWGVNTLFLASAGLDIFHIMLVNTTFTIGQIIFEVPTGVIADTIGRKAALLLGVATLFVSTLLYVGASKYGWGLPVFILASVFIGLGFTFQIGVTDAWLVDALDHFGWEGGKEQVFAWGGMTFSVAMLFGTIIGGVLGSFSLEWPYFARSAILAVCFFAILALIHDWGFQPRPLTLSRFGEETRTIFSAGVRYGWGNPVVRPLLFVSFVQGLFFLYAFYSFPLYFLNLLGKNLVWVPATVVAGSSIMGIAGNALVNRVMKKDGGRRRAGRVLGTVTVVQGALALGVASIGLFLPPTTRGVAVFGAAVVMWLAFGLFMGIVNPISQAFINEHIPSVQRATILSVSAFFGDVGGTIGQPTLGYVAKVASIPLGWAIGAIAFIAAAPLYFRADRAAAEQSVSHPSEPA